MITSFIPVPNMNPKKAPSAAAREISKGFLFIRNSAMNAPRKGPMTIPNGAKNIRPIISPIVENITAILDPPVFFYHVRLCDVISNSYNRYYNQPDYEK